MPPACVDFEYAYTEFTETFIWPSTFLAKKELNYAGFADSNTTPTNSKGQTISVREQRTTHITQFMERSTIRD